MFDYLPELRTLWHFAGEVRRLFEKEARVQTLWKRRAALLRKEKYQEVPELVEAMEMLEAGKFKKTVAFVYSPAGREGEDEQSCGEGQPAVALLRRRCGTSGGGGSGCSASCCWPWTAGGVKPPIPRTNLISYNRKTNISYILSWSRFSRWG